jgi:hypothetical protein
MRYSSLLVGLAVALGIVLCAPAASAQLADDASAASFFCDASISGSVCMSLWDQPADPYTGGAKEVKCPKATNYDSCIRNCDCEYAKAKNKCNGALFCTELASDEHNACTGHCITDYA